MGYNKKDQYQILIIDDNHKNLQVLGSLLMHEGYNLNAIQDSRKVMNFLKKNIPDLILLDIMMPVLDGFSLCKMIKAEPGLKDIPIIFMTAYDDISVQLEAFKRGAVDFITKPYQNEVVLARVKTHILLKTQYEKVRQSDAAKNKFFSIISHDLKNPLFAIMALAKANTENPSDIEKHIETSHYIYQSSQKMMKLIETVSLWNRNQQGRLNFTPVNVDLQILIQETEHLLTPQLKEKNMTLSYRFTPGLKILGDHDMLGIVLSNLISNAIKFSPEKTTITIAASITDKIVELRITDQGIGIPNGLKKRIFNLENAESRQGTKGETGTGLGLIICKDLIDRHNGTIRVESTPGKGSCFIITIPQNGEEQE